MNFKFSLPMAESGKPTNHRLESPEARAGTILGDSSESPCISQKGGCQLTNLNGLSFTTICLYLVVVSVSGNAQQTRKGTLSRSETTSANRTATVHPQPIDRARRQRIGAGEVPRCFFLF